MSKDEALAREAERTAERLASGANKLDHQGKAKALVVEYWNKGIRKGYPGIAIAAEDLYVVWFAYVLGNWKCLISSDAWVDTSYFEVSHSGERGETYVDHYHKVNNKRYVDASET